MGFRVFEDYSPTSKREPSALLVLRKKTDVESGTLMRRSVLPLLPSMRTCQ